ncbi:MAG: protein kinase [Stenomitos rutilans HA7619-LM2]|jgi:serine/threonine-protein kinase|nr:protein kinase [Stenomitos rutilans HA7619-LM2]
MSSCTAINQLLNDRYKIIKPLGKGGMGHTFVAEDTQRPNHPECVVKQLKPASTDPNFLVTARRLFNNEAMILEKLGRADDRIPQLLAYFEKEEEFYLVQDFVDGHPLTTEMPLGERWSEAQVIQLLKDVLSILEVVHQHSVIHRDIKPENLIRRKDGKIALIDFGAVKTIRLHQAAASGLISVSIGIGTPGYMPTEQAKGKPRPNSDLYALGMIAIQALTGMLPTQLRESDDGEVIWREQAEVSEALTVFLTRMVRYHFKERYETASEALLALNQLSAAAQSASPSSHSSASSSPGYTPTELNGSDEKASNPRTKHEAKAEVWVGGNGSDASSSQVQTPTEPVSPKAKLTPSNASSKKNVLIGAGVAVAIAGLIAGVSFMSIKNQQEQSLQQIQALHESDRFDECIDKAKTFPGFQSELSTKAQAIAGDCQVAKTQQLALEEIQKLRADNKHEEVISKAKAFSGPQSKFSKQAQNLADESQLALAQQLAKKGSYEKAIAVLTQIASDAPSAVVGEAQKLKVEWSERIYTLAEEKYQAARNDEEFKNALKIAKAIPQGSSAYEKAKVAMQRWNQAEQQNRSDASIAENALKAKDWETARAAANRLVSSPAKYWQQRATTIIQEVDKATLPILKREGVLDNNSPRREQDGTSYQDYTFEGSANQVITIMMESSDFDTRLFLVGSNDQVIAKSDDAFRNNYDAAIRSFTLPAAGTYRIRANAYSQQGRGRFLLTVLNSK